MLGVVNGSGDVCGIVSDLPLVDILGTSCLMSISHTPRRDTLKLSFCKRKRAQVSSIAAIRAVN